MDYFLFLSINSLAGKSAVLDWLGVIAAQYLIFLEIGAFAGLFLTDLIHQKSLIFFLSMNFYRNFLVKIKKNIFRNNRLALCLKNKKKDLFILTLLSVLIAVIIDFLISQIYFRPRPFVNSLTAHLLVSEREIGHTASFPSSHTLLAFVLAFSVFLYNKKIGLLFILGASAVGLARIFVGAHYPIDVLAGIAIAAGIVAAVKAGLARLAAR